MHIEASQSKKAFFFVAGTTSDNDVAQLKN